MVTSARRFIYQQTDTDCRLLSKYGNKHSGVVRLWMYDLYAESIEEDHKRRKIGAYAERPVVDAPVTPKAVKKAAKRRKVERFAGVEQKVMHKPLQVLAPVFTFVPETSILDLAIKALVNSPLPTFKIPKLAKIDKVIEKIDRKSVV